FGKTTWRHAITARLSWKQRLRHEGRTISPTICTAARTENAVGQPFQADGNLVAEFVRIPVVDQRNSHEFRYKRLHIAFDECVSLERLTYVILIMLSRRRHGLRRHPGQTACPVRRGPRR